MQFTYQIINWANTIQLISHLMTKGYCNIQESVHGKTKHLVFMHRDNHTPNEILRLGAELGRIDNNVYCRS